MIDTRILIGNQSASFIRTRGKGIVNCKQFLFLKFSRYFDWPLNFGFYDNLVDD